MKKNIILFSLLILFLLSLSSCKFEPAESEGESPSSFISDVSSFQPDPVEKSSTEAPVSASSFQSSSDLRPLSSSSRPQSTSSENPVDVSSQMHQNQAESVQISIYGLDGKPILSNVRYEFKKGESVADALKNVTRTHHIQCEIRGGYVKGIQNLYEFDEGPSSGWLYKVNGTFMSVGSGNVKVKAGDRIEWLYTLDMGVGQGAPQG